MVNTLPVTNRLPIVGRLPYGFLLKEHFKVYRYYFDYPQLYFGYRAPLHKRWLYYELNPSIFGGRRTATDHLLDLCSI